MEKTKLMKLVPLSHELNAKIDALCASCKKKENNPSQKHVTFSNGDLVYDDKAIAIEEEVKTTSELLNKLLPIALKIAGIKGYNDKLNILSDGTYVPESNISNNFIELIFYDKKVDDRFITLLNRAGIQPNMIQNLTAREQLKELRSNSENSLTNKTSQVNKSIKQNFNVIKRRNPLLIAPNKALTSRRKLNNMVVDHKKFNKRINWELASDSE